MSRVILEDLYDKRIPKEEVDTPIADAFRKVQNINEPLIQADLTRKRKKVKGECL